MLLECKNCGAPLDVKGVPRVVRCRYCGASAAMTHLRTLQPETPPGWHQPKWWSPPAHVPADSSKTYRYASRERTGLALGVMVAIVLGASLLGFVLLGGGGVGMEGDDGNCPASFAARGASSFRCRCGAGPPSGSVWGTGVYTTDSAVCRAALHSGAVSARGGEVEVTSAAGCSAYGGSTQNGVTTNSWGSYASSFYFVGHGDGRCLRATGSAAPNDACPASFDASRLGSDGALSCACSKADLSGNVWGTGIYTADSSLCQAAVHAGAISEAGGRVEAKPAPGCSAYRGSARHGVTSHSWGQYEKSFYFVGHGSAQCAP